MKLEPRYDGPSVLTIDDAPGSPLGPSVSQRRRFEAMLASLTAEQWASATRCEGWTPREVVAHLVSVNQFWVVSINGGRSGAPTKWLAGFDPVATPQQLVGGMGGLTADDVLEQFVASNATYLDLIGSLTDDEWGLTAESPAGHVPVQLLVQHGLWDAWIHERDIALPLGIAPVVDEDEVTSALVFAAAISPVLGLGLGSAEPCELAVEATDPDVAFVLSVADSVSIRRGAADSTVPTLRGEAVRLVEQLSLREPLGSETPSEWRRHLTSLERAFDV
ncbi:MAG: maleylpyruvate isomerase family mycothiol-dependent enzyme [Acidimicrobiales bacterium]